MIYVASSWRNQYQPTVISILRDAGFDVYDFRNPSASDNGFSWSEIDAKWESWDTDEYVQALDHPSAKRGYANDYQALLQADATVLILPCGRSAHLEAGFAVGIGQPVIAYLPEKIEPELMYKMFHLITDRMDNVIDSLSRIAIRH